MNGFTYKWLCGWNSKELLSKVCKTQRIQNVYEHLKFVQNGYMTDL